MNWKFQSTREIPSAQTVLMIRQVTMNKTILK